MTATSGGSRLTLLYIEDNTSNVQLVKRIFRDRDEVVLRTASRGQEGLEMARAELPGLILLDLHLPDMPGVEVLKELRREPPTAAIPVVVVSADATKDQISHLRASGVTEYVTKPFEVPRLLALVDSFVGSKPTAPSNTDAADGDAAAPAADSVPGDDELILDPSRVAELFGLDADGTTFRALVAVALEEAADRIAEISAAPVGGERATAVSAAAHSLKSSAAILGARRLAGLAEEVEQTARSGSLPDPSMLSALRHALTVTRQATNDAIGER
jgi:CheY-like chemotaxis protein